MKKFGNFLLVLFIAVFAITLFSCREEADPVGVVSVVKRNDEGVLVPATDAFVRIETLYEDVGWVYLSKDSAVHNWDQEVNEAGQATFKLKYEAILSVTAWIYTSGNDSITGKGILILKEGSTVSETVEIED